VATDVRTHPLALTSMILYSSVIRLAFSNFPPVSLPTFVDPFRLHVLEFIVARIALVYFCFELATDYPITLFAMDVLISLLLCWQLRLLDSAANARSPTLAIFYTAQLLLLASMPLWNKLVRQQLPGAGHSGRYSHIRWIGVSLAAFGVASEFAFQGGVLTTFRWFAGVVFMSMTTYYLVSQPWKGIDIEQSGQLKLNP
jgi:hypothetical protein